MPVLGCLPLPLTLGPWTQNLIPLAIYTEERSPPGGAPVGTGQQSSSVPGGSQAEASRCQLALMTGTSEETIASRGVWGGCRKDDLR